MRLLRPVETAHLSRLDAASRRLGNIEAELTGYELSTYWTLTHNPSLATKTVKLDQIAEVRLGRQRSPKNHTGESMRPYLRAANVGWSGLLLNDIKQMNFSEKEAITYELAHGDIVMSEASGSPREVGKPAMWRGEVDGCCFQNTLIRVRPTGVDPEFILHYIRADALRGSFSPESRGVGINHLGMTRMASWPVALPSHEEQRQAVAAIEEMRSQHRRMINSLDVNKVRSQLLRKSLLAEACAGRLVPQDPNDEPAPLLLERIRAERAEQPKPKRTRRATEPPQEPLL